MFSLPAIIKRKKKYEKKNNNNKKKNKKKKKKKKQDTLLKCRILIVNYCQSKFRVQTHYVTEDPQNGN